MALVLLAAVVVYFGRRSSNNDLTSSIGGGRAGDADEEFLEPPVDSGVGRRLDAGSGGLDPSDVEAASVDSTRISVGADGGLDASLARVRALGGVVIDIPEIAPGQAIPAGQRLIQAQSAISGFSDRVDRMSRELEDLDEDDEAAQAELQRKLHTATQSLALARVAEQAIQAEISRGHP